MKKLWTSPLVSFFREAILLYFSRRVPQAAACLAYFVILAVFPVLICVSYILGLVNIDVGSLIGQLQTILPQAALDVLESYLRYIAIHRSPGLFLAGLAGCWFSAAAAAHVGDELGLGLCAGGGVGDLLLVPQYVHALLAGVWEPGVADHPAGVAVSLRADLVFGHRVYQRLV